jgi:hypothetical protein
VILPGFIACFDGQKVLDTWAAARISGFIQDTGLPATAPQPPPGLDEVKSLPEQYTGLDE